MDYKEHVNQGDFAGTTCVQHLNDCNLKNGRFVEKINYI